MCSLTVSTLKQSIFARKESINKLWLRLGVCNTAECGTNVIPNKYRSSITNTDTCSKTHILKVKKGLSMRLNWLVLPPKQIAFIHASQFAMFAILIAIKKKKSTQRHSFSVLLCIRLKTKWVCLAPLSYMMPGSIPPCTLHSSWHTLCIWMRPKGLWVDGNI